MTERYRACPDAQKAWSRVAKLLAVYWGEGLGGFGRRNWREELGVRVSGSTGDPMCLLDDILSAEVALADLRRSYGPAYLLAAADIEGRGFWTPQHTGPADVLGLDRETGLRLFEGAKQYVYSLLEDVGISEDVVGTLTP